jgi:hypothetical protein
MPISTTIDLLRALTAASHCIVNHLDLLHDADMFEAFEFSMCKALEIRQDSLFYTIGTDAWLMCNKQRDTMRVGVVYTRVMMYRMQTYCQYIFVRI